MNIGIIVDGQAEYHSLRKLYDKALSPHTLLKPIYADIQPLAPTSQIVGVIKRKLPILRNMNASKILVLIDRETRDICPGEWATQIRNALDANCTHPGTQDFAVVVKNTCYENWLISDTSIFRKMPKRFSLRAAQLRSVEPDKADRVDAQAILKAAAIRDAYDKVADSICILNLADPTRMAQNSRSFRRFLRELSS